VVNDAKLTFGSICFFNRISSTLAGYPVFCILEPFRSRMNKKSTLSSALDVYQNKSKIKWVLLGISFLISVGSIYYTNRLVNQLKDRERRQIELYAKALEYTINEDFEYNILFVTEEILYQNSSIPTILVAGNGFILDHKNIRIPEHARKDPLPYLTKQLEKMKTIHPPIEVRLRDPQTGEIYEVQQVYYKNSYILTQLTNYPYVQLSVIAIFAFIAYLAFNYSKAAEQNRVWVGLAKETAHQLGTPLSSLMAWVEYFREDEGLRSKGIVDELDKDIKKLQVITERFSNIGSAPVLKEENIYEVITNTVNYLRPRISTKVNIQVTSLQKEIYAQINAPLFEWVIENLCKNAVDAMAGNGELHVRILRGNERKVFIDITDTGKGIPKSTISKVFNPGFTTKKRGWGLGLTLVKRIIEVYHQGRIFVKSSEENIGTTFRIVLPAQG
jgi:hypothetical protein